MNKKILIIEDEEFLSSMYKMKFEAEGYTTLIAEDGEEGLAMAKKEKPDLILLDLVMPKKDGFETLRALREDADTMKTKTYILSNLGQDEEVKQSFDLGADGFLIKANLTPAQLMEHVKKILAGEKVGERLRKPMN